MLTPVHSQILYIVWSMDMNILQKQTLIVHVKDKDIGASRYIGGTIISLGSLLFTTEIKQMNNEIIVKTNGFHWNMRMGHLSVAWFGQCYWSGGQMGSVPSCQLMDRGFESTGPLLFIA
jgi:hypothetical protein